MKSRTTLGRAEVAHSVKRHGWLSSMFYWARVTPCARDVVEPKRRDKEHISRAELRLEPVRNLRDIAEIPPSQLAKKDGRDTQPRHGAPLVCISGTPHRSTCQCRRRATTTPPRTTSRPRRPMVATALPTSHREAMRDLGARKRRVISARSRQFYPLSADELREDIVHHIEVRPQLPDGTP